MKKQQLRTGEAKKPKLQSLKLNFEDVPERGFDEVDQPKTDAGVHEYGSGNCNMLHQYKWHIVNTAGIHVRSAPMWSFIEDVYVATGQAAIDSYKGGEQTSVIIEKRDQLQPPPVELHKMVYTHLARKHASSIAHQECEGCLIDHPSQLEHMGLGGCLSGMPCMVEHYLPGIREQVQPSTAAALIRTLCEKYALTVHPMFEEPLTLPSVTSADLYTYCLIDNEDYSELFDSIC